MDNNLDYRVFMNQFTYELQQVMNEYCEDESYSVDLIQDKIKVDGEEKAYNEMMNEARALATKRMVEEAESLGADAVVNIRYASSAVMQGAAEVIAYGTAVKFTN